VSHSSGKQGLLTRKGKMLLIQALGIIGVMFATSFIWYWTGHKDGVREGYTRGRSISRQEFWKE
jgi:hypothetical protein